MEVGIRVEAENIQQRTVRHTNSCYFTMVAVDENGKPTPVPPLEIKNELMQCRFDAAEERKKMRMQQSNRPSCEVYKSPNEELTGASKPSDDLQ